MSFSPPFLLYPSSFIPLPFSLFLFPKLYSKVSTKLQNSLTVAKKNSEDRWGARDSRERQTLASCSRSQRQRWRMGLISGVYVILSPHTLSINFLFCCRRSSLTNVMKQKLMEQQKQVGQSTFLLFHFHFHFLSTLLIGSNLGN
jgi:hypothetical protein